MANDGHDEINENIFAIIDFLVTWRQQKQAVNTPSDILCRFFFLKLSLENMLEMKKGTAAGQ